MTEEASATTTAPPAPDVRRQRLDGFLRARSVGGSMLWTIFASGLTLALNLFTGVLNARLLQPTGRGQLEAVTTWLRVGPVITNMGVTEGLAYEQARAKRADPSMNVAAIAALFVMGTLTLVVAQLLIPYGFRAQSDDIVQLARVAMVGVYAVLGSYLVRALLVGANYFVGQSLLAVGEPAFYAVVALALWGAGAYSVTSVLLAQIGSFVAVTLVGGGLLWYLGGLRPVQRGQWRTITRYGLRSHVGTLGSVGNARLDLLLLPAVVAAAEIGLYAVAVSIASMVVLLFGQVARVVFTGTVGADEEAGGRLIERSLRLVLMASSAAALGVAVVAPVVIPPVYGADFTDAVVPLRILLPGIVLWTAGGILEAGLQGSGRPGRSSLAQLYGLVLTVVGLWWSLPRYGIIGAAWTSTVAYSSIFVVRFWFLHRAGLVSVRRLASPAVAAADASVVLRRALALVRR